MSVRELPTLPLVFNRLIYELLERQATYTDFNENDLLWGTEAIAAILPELKVELIYKNFVYMNTASKIGKFALWYRDQMANAIVNRDESALHKLLATAWTPEFDDNYLLTPEVELQAITQLKKESVILNALVDRMAMKSILPMHILESDDHTKCKEDVCVWSLPSDGVASNTYRDRVLMLDRTTDPSVWVADQRGTQLSYEAYCFKLPELIKIIRRAKKYSN